MSLISQYAQASGKMRGAPARLEASSQLDPSIWRGGRAVECTGLENRRSFTGTVGSNPTLSAKLCSVVRRQTRFRYVPESVLDDRQL